MEGDSALAWAAHSLDAERGHPAGTGAGVGVLGRSAEGAGGGDGSGPRG